MKKRGNDYNYNYSGNLCKDESKQVSTEQPILSQIKEKPNENITKENTYTTSVMEENKCLARKIKEMKSEIDSLNELKLTNERLISENKILAAENTSLKSENKELQKRLEDIKNQSQKANDDVFQAKIQEIEKHYLNALQEKDDQFDELNSNFTAISNENNSKNAIIEQLTDFISKNRNLLNQSNLDFKDSPDIQCADVGMYLTLFDKLITKLLRDNSEFENQINQLISAQVENQEPSNLKENCAHFKYQEENENNNSSLYSYDSKRQMFQMNKISNERRNMNDNYSPLESTDQFEKLKSKIRELECKIIEINKDDEEKKIINSLKEFRKRNMSP